MLIENKMQPWSWFSDKVLPPVFAALCISAVASGFATYQAVQALTSKVEQNDRELVQLKARIEAVDAHAVKRAELLETMKRVELQLELMMAKAGMRK
jgi:cell division protein FtsB